MPISSVSRDFRSDTLTSPPDHWFAQMQTATRGDDVYFDDDTTNEIQRRVAKLAGKEDALFMVSGTMSNQVALRTHLNRPPHSVLLDSRAHVYVNEAGGLAVLSQAQVTPVVAKNLHHLTWDDDISPALIHGTNIHTCPTRVISLENTLNGMIFPQEELVKIRTNVDIINKERKEKESDECQIIIHCDGARIPEVAAKTGKPLSELCAPFDSVSICFSKGLGAPIGSILVGSKKFIDRARWYRKMFGGGIRQCGPITTLLNRSLDEVLPQLPRVHSLAKTFAQGLADEGVNILLPVETNMVFIDTKSAGFEIEELIQRAETLNPPLTIRGERLVLHWQIEEQAIKDIIGLVKVLKDEKKAEVKQLNGEKIERLVQGDWTALTLENSTQVPKKKDPYTGV